MSGDTFLPFSKPFIDQTTIKEVIDTLQSGWLATGPKVKQFQSDLQHYFSIPHAIPVTSGTAGLHLALLALGIEAGDEVITTPLTFVSTLNTIVHCGATPVLVDVDLKTYNIDIHQIEAAITKKTKAIIPVHFAGLPVHLTPLYHLAKQYQLRVIEDAAHAIGSEYENKKIGSFGDIQVFSFHPNKNITSGEGGCVTTADPIIAKKITHLAFHGIDREVWNRHGKTGQQDYDVIEPGFKYNMMDLQAAIGLHQLPLLTTFNQRRAKLAQHYSDAFSTWPELQLPIQPNYTHQHAWHLFAPLIQPAITGFPRDAFIAKMKEKNIGIGFHYKAAHLFQFYQQKFGYKLGDFPVAEFISEHIMSLPLFPAMTDIEQEYVIETMKKIFKR